MHQLHGPFNHGPTAHVVHRRLPPKTGIPAELSKRQREVLVGVSNGHTSEQIAADLGISVSAVKQHITAVCEKLGASSRAEAVTIALKRNLLKM